MLEALCLGLNESKHDIVGVFRIDNVIYSPFKRLIKDKLFPSNDYRLVKTLYLYDILAKSVNCEKFRKKLKKLNTDVIIIGSWSEKFSKETIETPNIATINVHPSLLPKYRGPNPYFSTIINSEKQSGVTFHLVNEDLDKGKILEQFEISISPQETGKSLKYKCTNTVCNNISNLLDNLNEKINNAQIQDENQASYYKQITLKESILDFTKEDSQSIDRRIRALNPWMQCNICYKDEFFTFEAHKITGEKSDFEAGTIVKKTNNSLSIVCSDGNIIEFFDLKIRRIFSKLLTKIYLKHFIQINTKAR